MSLRTFAIARRFAVTVLLLAITATAHAEQPDAGSPLAWLAGHWCGEHRGTRIEEHWLARGQHLLGLSASTRDGKLREFEYLRIEPRDGGGWSYIAQPSGGPPIAFALIESAEDSATFANPDHDYPQRIRYWRDPAGLHAEIAKLDSSQPRRFDYGIGCAAP